jgi:hypothetical protein
LRPIESGRTVLKRIFIHMRPSEPGKTLLKRIFIHLRPSETGKTVLNGSLSILGHQRLVRPC